MSCFRPEVTLSCGTFMSSCKADVCRSWLPLGLGTFVSHQQGSKTVTNLQECLFVGTGNARPAGTCLVEQLEHNTSPGMAGSKMGS